RYSHWPCGLIRRGAEEDRRKSLRYILSLRIVGSQEGGRTKKCRTWRGCGISCDGSSIKALPAGVSRPRPRNQKIAWLEEQLRQAYRLLWSVILSPRQSSQS